jgi:hypothetical protein
MIKDTYIIYYPRVSIACLFLAQVAICSLRLHAPSLANDARFSLKMLRSKGAPSLQSMRIREQFPVILNILDLFTFPRKGAPQSSQVLQPEGVLVRPDILENFAIPSEYRSMESTSLGEG